LSYEGLEQALCIEGAEVRLFGKPISYVRRRMGVALAVDENTDKARIKARKVAACIRPVTQA
jgi:phosphoribosylglycinamide formyltransferase 2